MSIKLIKNFDQKIIQDWDSFVYQHPDGNIFQTPKYFSIIESQGHNKPIRIIISDNDKIVGVLIGEQLSENKFYGMFTKRVIIRGGPLVRDGDNEFVKFIMNAYNEIVPSDAIFSEFRPVGKINPFQKINKSVLIPEERYDILVDLRISEAELFQQMHSTRKRQIKRGYKRGLELEIIENADEKLIIECYSILATTYSKIKLPLNSLQYFVNAAKNLGHNLKLFLVRFENELVGFRVVLCYKDLIYDWYAASKEKHNDKYPNDILPWEVIRWGANNFYKTFDFGGAGKPGEHYGVRDFKMKFGGELITNFRYKIVHKPFLMQIGKIGIKISQKI